MKRSLKKIAGLRGGEDYLSYDQSEERSSKKQMVRLYHSQICQETACHEKTSSGKKGVNRSFHTKT